MAGFGVDLTKTEKKFEPKSGISTRKLRVEAILSKGPISAKVAEPQDF